MTSNPPPPQNGGPPNPPVLKPLVTPNLTIDTSAASYNPSPATAAAATASATATMTIAPAVPARAPEPGAIETPSRRSSSPPRPPVSPITPTLAPARLTTTTSSSSSPSTAAATNNNNGNNNNNNSTANRTANDIMASLPPRQTFAHAQPNQVGVAPPPPKPISFDENPDVLALQSAIAVLQMQKRRAEGDIKALHRAKGEALRDTQGFVRDLVSDKIKATGALGFESVGAGDDDDDDGDDSDEDEKNKERGPAWRALPGRQDVVRCPPINWAQYAVVGDSLDKLHAEQRASPTQGVPATIAADGTYDFNGDGQKTQFVGIAAPYTPGRDRLIDKKPKVPRR